MKKKIKVLHLNFDDDKSGASKAVYRIHSALIKKKIKSSVLVVKKFSNFKNYIKLSKNKISLNFIKRLFSYTIKYLQNINSKNIHRSYNFFSNTKIVEYINRSNFDIIHIHWINGEMLSLNDILKIKKPLIWTFHDLWPVLPTQHVYNKRIMQPIKKTKWENFFLAKKKKLFRSKNISIVCPSYFIKNQLPEWVINKNQMMKVIPNTIDFKMWHVNDKLISQKKINLPNKYKILTFHLPGKNDDFIKGTDIFIKILKYFKNRNDVKFLLFGSKRKEISRLSNNIYNFSFVKNNLDLLNIYNSSDLVISTSRFESFGQVMLEASSCGVPCIAYVNTAVKEVINNNKNILVKKIDSKEYIRKIEKFLVTPNLRKRKKVNKILFTKFNHNKVAHSYVKYYKETINNFFKIN